MPTRLKILFVAPHPPSPATFGAQRRIEGLMRALARHNEVSFVGLVPPYLDGQAAIEAMRSYCVETRFVAAPEAGGFQKRWTQLASLASAYSFERRSMATSRFLQALRDTLSTRDFDVISVEAPFLDLRDLRLAGPGGHPPRVVLDAHNVEFELARQYARRSNSLHRRLYHAVNWRKLRREEIAAWREADAVAFTSTDDQARATAILPGLHSLVVPNGVDVESFRPATRHAATPTVAFFGTMNYYPNLDGVRWMLREIWPRVIASRPDARLRIIGSHPPEDVVAAQGPNVEVMGLVDDIQAQVTASALVAVPLRIGSGTRLKILESLAMAMPVVSTPLGAEGIPVKHDEHLVLADDPEGFAKAIVDLLSDDARKRRIGQNARRLAEERFSWRAIGDRFEEFIRSLRDARRDRSAA